MTARSFSRTLLRTSLSGVQSEKPSSSSSLRMYSHSAGVSGGCTTGRLALCGAPAKPPGSLAAPWENDEVVT